MIRLHHCAQTRSMRTLWLLHELGVEFEVVSHAFGKNLRSVEYLALNPAGRVPALEIDGDTMFETGAITEYLCELYPETGMGRLPGEDERRDWLVWLHFAETISQHSAALTQQHIALYDASMRSAIVTRLEAKRLEKCYGAIEARLAESGDYLLKGGFSAADISVGQALYMSLHFARLDAFPLVTSWYRRLTLRDGFIASEPKELETRLYPKEFYEPWEG